MVRPLDTGRGDTGRLCALFFALSLSACAEHHADMLTGAPPPPNYEIAATPIVAATLVNQPSPEDLQPRGLIAPEAVPVASVNYMGAQLGGSAMARQPGFAIGLLPTFSLNQKGGGHSCNFGDRFDRKATLAYNFDSNHQLAFKMGIHDHDGGLEMSHALLAFHYRFNSVKSPMEAPREEKCRYASHWQGLIGSGYNELMLRDTNTIWGEARDRGLDFWH